MDKSPYSHSHYQMMIKTGLIILKLDFWHFYKKMCQIFFWNAISGKYQVCTSEQNKRFVVRVTFMNSIDYLEKLLLGRRIHTKSLGHMAKLLPAPWSPSWSLRRIPLSWAPSLWLTHSSRGSATRGRSQTTLTKISPFLTPYLPLVDICEGIPLLL